MKDKINVLIIGSGHYSAGSTVLEGKVPTDKDTGILLPSVLELKKQGYINDIYLATRDGKKIPRLRKKIKFICNKFGWDADLTLFPKNKVVDEKGYKKALTKLPKPGAVLIAVPDFLHKQMVIDSIKHGFHFMVVKPIVIKLKDLYDIINLMKKQNVLGLIDYHKVYDEANLILKDDYRNDRYGDIQHIFVKMTQRRDMLKIFGKWIAKQGHNINHYLGSHYIHMVGFITNATPLNVRATAQYGIAKKEYGIDTPDVIETQIEWMAKNKTKFVSYHVSGWSDPSETASMTYQEMHMVGTKGHIESDQRFRGFETTLVDEGYRIINPYFFHTHENLFGDLELNHKYGFKSVKTFLQSALAVENGKNRDYFEGKLPTVKDSTYVTAILEATDKSLQKGGQVIKLNPKS